MNELTKTIVFVGVAAASVAAAFLGRPGRVGTETPDEVGQAMFAEMDDPMAAQSLEIVEFDEDRGKPKSFSVDQRQGLWVLPAYENYAADATENLQAAATMFVGLEIVNVAGDDKASHGDFGVLDPTSDTAGTTPENVGKLIRMKDDKGSRLVELVIGKEVPGNDGQRFVRRPGQDRVYTVVLDSSKLSTKFEDWVVQDVLELDAMQIKQIAVRDYSVTPVMTQRGPQLMQDERLSMQVSWNGDDFKWDLDELLEFRNKKMLPTELLEDEELDKDVLDELKNALADLKIVDVAAKPAALREGLKGSYEKLAQDREGQQSLVDRGFYPVGIAEGGIDIASTDGEIVVKTNDNIQYELYFGQIAGSETEGDKSSLNRFVMIAAKVDEAAIPQPELADVPELAGPAVVEGEDADEVELTEEQKAANLARDAIIKENERKQNEYDDAMKKAKEKVGELNFRLADWYYVVSEEVYNDIHLSRKDVIKVKDGSTESGYGADAFRELEEKGLEREEKTNPAAATP